MKDTDWFEFCAHEYRRSADRSEILYTRYGFVATVGIALGASGYKLLVDIASEFDKQSLAHITLAVCVAWLSIHLLLAIIYICMSIFSSGDFRDISSTQEFQAFSDQYEHDMRQEHDPDGNVLEVWKQTTLREGLMNAMQEAEQINQSVANDRLKWTRWATAQLAAGSALVLVAAIARIVIEFG